MELTSRVVLDGSIPYEINAPVPERVFLPRITQDAKIACLERVPVFEGFTERQLRRVAGITKILEAEPGRVLTATNELGNEFFIIVDGFVRVAVGRENQPRLGPGQFFGEMSLLDGQPRSATVVADTAVRLLVIDRRDFWKLLKEVPTLTEKLLVMLSQRVRRIEKAASA
jgi:CRP/FNR family transcriptional regulator/CRP/FNR family cyclic AMP-dependent transcriptional regulator